MYIHITFAPCRRVMEKSTKSMNSLAHANARNQPTCTLFMLYPAHIIIKILLLKVRNVFFCSVQTGDTHTFGQFNDNTNCTHILDVHMNDDWKRSGFGEINMSALFHKLYDGLFVWVCV